MIGTRTQCSGDGARVLAVLFFFIRQEVDADIRQRKASDDAVAGRIYIGVSMDDRSESGRNVILESVVVFTLRCGRKAECRCKRAR